MIKRLLLSCVLLAGTFPMLARAADVAATSQPSDSSVRELLAVTKVRELMESSSGALKQNAARGLTKALGSGSPNARQQQIIERGSDELVAYVRQHQRYEEMEPEFIAIYRSSFTQADVDGMLAFYRSPAGASVIEKMPSVMNQTLALIQQRLELLVPGLVDLQGKLMKELQDAGDPAPIDVPAPAAPAKH